MDAKEKQLVFVKTYLKLLLSSMDIQQARKPVFLTHSIKMSLFDYR
ncbi:MAG: hypothetical protein JWP45_3554 [Mucilaginibacter sp.]|nr:hypothetical protein [Mucilaginibacter sp.]